MVEAHGGAGMTTGTDKQWRIDNASHLEGVRLQLRRYARLSESWDHDHCAACWAKFAELEGPDIQQEGYTTGDGYPRRLLRMDLPGLLFRSKGRHALDGRRRLIACS